MDEHLIQLIIQALLALAIFSFLEYSIRTLHAPEVVNRRAKLICAAGLTLFVVGIWMLILLSADPFYRAIGLALALLGNLIALITMFWLETRSRRRKKAAGKQKIR